MSGQTPRHAFALPISPAADCRIPVDRSVVAALREQIPIARDASMRWVDDEFNQAAKKAFNVIGRPSLTSVAMGWAIFEQMCPLIVYQPTDIDIIE
jgi:hypothetical protein